jgi:tryptophanyl-tRNA synthetase
MQRVFSAIQPTGRLHLGNYLGAIRNWVHLTNANTPHTPDAFVFALADLHALTIPNDDPASLRRDTIHLAATLLGCGLDPSKCILFQQSSVPQHSELSWILSCMIATNRLSTMTQYKDKVRKGAQPYLGLFTYPVLMSADILLYRSTHVPVGDDQTQHLELARYIASAFNRRFSNEFFPVPEQFKGTYHGCFQRV